jgi:hypothetical protein
MWTCGRCVMVIMAKQMLSRMLQRHSASSSAFKAHEQVLPGSPAVCAGWCWAGWPRWPVCFRHFRTLG